MAATSLNGRVLAFVEARMPAAMAGLIRRHGGVPYAAPVLQENYLTDSPEVQQAIIDICAGRVDTAIFLTGVGANAMMGIADAMGRQAEFEAALRAITVVARSPKPGRILRRHQIPIDIMPPEPYTSSDLTAAMSDLPLRGQQVVFQRYGGPDSELPAYLREQGAIYRELTLYDWGLPDDTGPVLELIDRMERGAVDALAFTSRPRCLTCSQLPPAPGGRNPCAAAWPGRWPSPLWGRSARASCVNTASAWTLSRPTRTWAIWCWRWPIISAAAPSI